MQTEILATEKLSNERWLNLFARTFRRGGQTYRWLFASRKPDPAANRRADAVLIVPILLDGGVPGGELNVAEPKLVATREWRATIGDYEWGVPAGLIDGDEDYETTARRELMEETGYELVEVLKTSPPNYSSTGMTDELVVIVFCTCRTPREHTQHLDGAELIEVHPLTLGEIDKLVDTQEPINGRAWGVFYLYHRLGRLL
jgi:ADP-ribose pyrophosphatase